MKKKKTKSIKLKIFIVFLCFIGFAGILIGINNYFHTEKNKLTKRLHKLTAFENNVSKAVYYQNLVFLKDFSQVEYYTQKNNYNTLLYSQHYKKAVKELKKFKSDVLQKNTILNTYYTYSKEELKKIDHYFNKIVYLQKIRGFRDAGIEGRMRNYAHWIEKNAPTSDLKTNVLQLRRHEKDFFLRGDSIYATKLKLEATILLQKLKPNQDSLKKVLHLYTASFDSIYTIDKLTGIRTGKSYANLLSIYTSQLNASVNQLYTEYKNHYQLSLKKIDNLQLFATIVLIGIGLLMSLILASSITMRIRSLSTFMNAYVESKFKQRSRFEPDFNNDEITTLIKNVELLEQEITVHFEKYKAKVIVRTEEILKQKAEIEKQNAIIEEKNNALTIQKNILDLQNHHILDGLKAAKELQRAFFPSQQKLNTLLGCHFLKFEPLDIVSGDFYWVEKSDDSLYIAIADCTGHGAHGALMSINGINLLNHALKEKKISEPYSLLNYLSHKIHELFNAYNESSKHSIDIALIRICNNNLYFAGAQRNAYILSPTRFVELKGDRKPLGWMNKTELYSFTQKEITLQEGDKLILFTDGLTDQLGGPENKKFKSKHFIHMIEKLNTLSTADLFDFISDSYHQWKNDNEQTDDLCVLCVEAYNENAVNHNLVTNAILKTLNV